MAEIKIASGKEKRKLGLGLLIALGVGSMICAGIFNSPTDLIGKANPLSTIIAWSIGGFGVINLALVFRMLSNAKPELKGGIYSYAKAGFGEFVGFNSAWGYWMSSFLGNVAFFILIFKTINSLIGESYNMNTFLAFVLASALLWFYQFIISKGIKEASVINAFVTVAKIIPIILVIVFGALVFSSGTFNVDNWKNILASTGDKTTLFAQVKGAMGTILWCFIGVEASVVMSERADEQRNVGKATVLSLIITLFLYMLISVIAMGAVPAKDLSGASTPLALVLQSTALGNIGGYIVKVGIIISVLGGLLCWILLTSEIPYVAAKDQLLPKWFSKENKKGVPINSLLFTSLATQVFLLTLLSPGLQGAYNKMYTIATTNVLVPYLLCALFAFKVCMQEKASAMKYVVSGISIIYAVYVIYAVGMEYLGLAFILYAIGIPVFVKSIKEKKGAIMKKDIVAMVVMVAVAAYMVFALATGSIAI